jgi:DedD protein
MAFFKFRKAGDEAAAAPAQPESVEALRRRARHRLIGASVLVLIGVVGFPLLFDTQPRPIAVDIPIEIPDRNKAKPLPVPAQAAASKPVVAKPAASTAVAATPASAPASRPAEKVAAAPAQPAAPKPEPKEPAKPEPKPEPKAEPKAEPKEQANPKAAEAARAQALLEGKPPAAAEGRFVVQVGAFADVAKARETRLKVEKAGLKTYTNVAETKDGKRIRVRVGPFATRAEADKAADKIKGLDLPAAILSL